MAKDETMEVTENTSPKKTAKKKERDPDLPEWVTNNNRIDEPAFCEYFAKEYGIACMNGIFYNYEGAIEEPVLRTVIYDCISPYIKNKVSASVSGIVESLRLH